MGSKGSVGYGIPLQKKQIITTLKYLKIRIYLHYYVSKNVAFFILQLQLFLSQSYPDDK